MKLFYWVYKNIIIKTDLKHLPITSAEYSCHVKKKIKKL